jgi:uncharacterized protein DUF5989
MKKTENIADTERQPGFLDDLVYFVRHSRKWWMVPLVVLLALVGVLMLLGGTGAAPFIYTLF